MPATLITTFYNVESSARLEEYAYALDKNIGNMYIQRIFILAERGARLHDAAKVEYIDISRRPTFHDACAVAYTHCKGEVIVIANSDIYFDHTSKPAFEHIRSRECYALTRWEWNGDGRFMYHPKYHSQDAWIIRDLPHSESIGRYYFGQYGCDNKFAAELTLMGIKVTNPSMNVRAIHVHKSDYRTYEEGKFLEKFTYGLKYIPPTLLLASPYRAIVIPLLPGFLRVWALYIYEIWILKSYRKCRSNVIEAMKTRCPGGFERIKKELIRRRSEGR